MNLPKSYNLNVKDVYEIHASVSGHIGCKKINIGKKGRCRFCNGDTQTFKERAHTFPEALGNKWIFSLDECDECNDKFSKLETSLIDCLKPILTLGGVKGKKKVPQTGRSAGNNSIKHSNNDGKRHLSWKSKPDSNSTFFSMDFDNANISSRFTVPSIPFVPRYAYQAIAKMAYALLPENELPNYEKLRKWLQNPNENLYYPKLETLMSFAMIGNSPPLVAGYLYKRTAPIDSIPYMVFLFLAGSICIQINLISDHFDENVPLSPIGRIKIGMVTTIAGGNDSMELQFSEPHPMNWTSIEKQPQPIQCMEFKFNQLSRHGVFKPIFRNL
jgi:hypothetical protein